MKVAFLHTQHAVQAGRRPVPDTVGNRPPGCQKLRVEKSFSFWYCPPLAIDSYMPR